MSRLMKPLANKSNEHFTVIWISPERSGNRSPEQKSISNGSSHDALGNSISRGKIKVLLAMLPLLLVLAGVVRYVTIMEGNVDKNAKAINTIQKKADSKFDAIEHLEEKHKGLDIHFRLMEQRLEDMTSNLAQIKAEQRLNEWKIRSLENRCTELQNQIPGSTLPTNE